MLTYTVNDYCTSNTKQFTFPAGEVGIQTVQPPKYGDFVRIKAILKSSDDVMALLMLNDAIRRQVGSRAIVILDMPYIPYARQDRVCNEGEALSIAVFAQLINSCNFDEVVVLDPHSEVAPALINNVRIKTQIDVFRDLKLSWRNTLIVAPDAGAYKKSHKFAEAVGAMGVVSCNKVRELSTGKILGLEVVGKVHPGAALMVLDDICDGGRTFIELAKALEQYDVRTDLAVTHGLFTKGLEVVAECYDTVYTTNSFYGNDHPVADNVIWKEV